MARKKGCTIDIRNGHHVVLMGDMEIWDGADLALLRETLARMVDTDHHKSIGVDLTFVKYIPSGFFGMLYDYAEFGVSVRVYGPHPHIRQMLWFREFFDDVGGEAFSLTMRAQTKTSQTERQLAARAPWAESDAPAQVPNFEPDHSRLGGHAFSTAAGKSR